MRDELRTIVTQQGGLRASLHAIGDEDDLFVAGMDSLAVVRVMIAIEEQFGIELPEHLLNRSSFSSIAALERAVRTVVA